MKLRIVPFLFILPLSACGLWNEYTQPKTEAPAQWNTPLPAAPAWPEAAWWNSFGSPTLAALIAEAETANFDLQAAFARVRQADAQLRISGAGLFPFLDLSAGADRSKQPGSVINGGRVENSFSAVLSAGYELDFWGRNWAASESARALAEASRFDRETVRLSVLSSVANTYFSILATTDRLAVARENLANAEALLESIRKRFEQGLVSALDLARQESIASTQAAAVPPLELALAQQKNALALLLGKLPETLETPQGTLADITVPEIAPGLPSELLTRRPDVQAAEAQLIAASADIVAARAAMFPNIRLTADGGYRSDELARLFRPDSMLFSLAASLAQPIFRGGSLFGALDLSQARRDELLQAYRKSVVSAFVDVEDALAAAQQNAALEQAQQESVRISSRAYELSQQQFRGGITDITAVLDTQRALFTAQDAQVQARLLRLQAAVGLYRALGGGWKSPAISAHVSGAGTSALLPE